MGSTTRLQLDDKLAIAIMGKDYEFDTTTNITTNNSVISTTVIAWDEGRDDFYNNWWMYITEGNNTGKVRRVSDYATATGTLTVSGAALVAETGAVTCRLYVYDRDDAITALNNAIREVFPSLFQDVDDMTLVTGNHLPDGSFENWSSSSALTWYTASNITLVQTTTASLIRGPRGTTSAKCTATAGNGYIYVDSYTFPRLLDFMGKTVSFKARAYPQTANDAYLVIYTLKADGTAQTLTSTTTNAAAAWTLLELEDQTLNDDLVKVELRFKVATSGQYVYFDEARFNGIPLYEYLMPYKMIDGIVERVYVQNTGSADDPCDDLYPNDWQEDFYHPLISDGTYQYIYIGNYPELKRIRIQGKAPISTLSSDTATVTLTEKQINKLIAYTGYLLFKQQGGNISNMDMSRVKEKMADFYSEYQRLNTNTCSTGSLRLPSLY